MSASCGTARWTAPELVAHAAEPVWLARWAGHLQAQSWAVSSHLVGWLLAAAVDAGNDEVFELLVASADGTDEVATMGRHVPIALLCAERTDGWECVERLLLSAQRQEGLRQSILEVVDEAHPEALRRMLALIAEHDLSRFASVTRAIAVWFGLELFAGERRRIDAIAESALTFLSDPDARREATRSGDPLDVYVALWAAATEDVHAAIETADEVLGARDAECRYSAVAFLSQTAVEEAFAGLLRALSDEDLRVAAAAVPPLNRYGAGVLPESYDVIEQLLDRVPKRSVQLEASEWFGPLSPLKRDEVGKLLLRHRDPPDVDRVLPRRAALETWDRRHLVECLCEGPLTADRRAALLDSLGDASPHVREMAISAAAEVEISDDEALALESLLRRKPGDLRRGVLELILARGDAWALDAAERLLGGSEQERLGGVELLRRARGRRVRGRGGPARHARRRHGRSARRGGDAPRARRQRAHRLTEADGFGLFDPSRLTPITPPRATGFSRSTPASRRVLQLLDALIEQHADVEVLLDRHWGDPERLLLGAVEYAGLADHLDRSRRGETETEVPLLEVWERFTAELPADARDDDGLQILRASLSCADAEARYRWDERSKAAAKVGVRHFRLVSEVLALLLVLQPDEHLLAGVLDATEADLAALSKSELRERADSPWGADTASLQIARSLAGQRFAHEHTDLLRRYWRLERWLSEPPGVKPEITESQFGGPPHPRHSDRIPNRPPIEVVVRAFEHGAATEHDLIDHLVGPRGSYWTFRDLGDVSSRRQAERVGAGAATLAVVERVRERIITVELARGEAPTQAAEAVRALSRSGGLDVLVGALGALGRERLVRGWTTDGEGRASVFSHVIATSHPDDGDTPERFAAAVREAKISDRRLRELACYAPQWSAHVEATLGVSGLAHAVWWLHAHTKDDRWSVEQELKAEWERSVGDRTELSAEQLVDGAVDVRWFAEVRSQIDDEDLDALLGAAKYGSTAGGHKRAELFARAMRGDLDDGELLERVSSKRHQDSVRALGLLPLPEGEDPRREVLARRYEALHQFRRESRQFGKQRQASEGRATDIGFENLARTAGFTDPARLTWAMEAAATADLAGDGATIEHDDVSVTLRVGCRRQAGGRGPPWREGAQERPGEAAQGPGDQGVHIARHRAAPAGIADPGVARAGDGAR